MILTAGLTIFGFVLGAWVARSATIIVNQEELLAEREKLMSLVLSTNEIVLSEVSEFMAALKAAEKSE